MKKIAALFLFVGLSLSTQAQDKLITKTGHINFFSHTSAEDISADNYQVTSTMAPGTGDVVFVVPMQSFEFEKALMQKHFNQPKFLDTKQFPKAKFKGKIDDLSGVDFSKDGTYNVTVSGDMTLHGVTKSVKETGKIIISGGKVSAETKMKIVLADYNIAFEKGKTSTNIAKEVDVTVKVKY